MKLSVQAKIDIMLLIIVLSAIDFMGKGIYIMSSLVIIVLLFFPSECMRCICELNFSKFLIFTVFCTIMNCIMTSNFNNTFIAEEIIMPVSMYLCGYCFITNKYNKRISIIKPIYIVTIGCSLYGYLTAMNKGDLSVYSKYTDEYVNNLMRSSYNIWNNNLISGTVLSIAFIPGIAAMFYFAFCIKGKKKIVLLACSLLAVYGSLLLGSRANLTILSMVFAVLAVVLICDLKSVECKKIFKRLIVFLIIFMACFAVNAFKIRDIIFNTTLFVRIKAMDTKILDSNGRFDIYSNYFKLFIDNPFGGIKNSGGFSTHNTFLQFGAFGGIIGICLSLWFYVPFLFSIIKSSLKDTSVIKFLTLPIAISIIMVFMVESVVLSNSIMYSILVMYLVIIDQYYRKMKGLNYENFSYHANKIEQ